MVPSPAAAAALAANSQLFAGPVEVGETQMGAKRQTMSNAWRKQLAGQTAVVGANNRETNQVVVRVTQSSAVEPLQGGFVADHADAEAAVCTDDATPPKSLPLDHDTGKHSLSE